MRRIGLVGCTAQKRKFAAPARELYDASPLFRYRRAWVERFCDRWFILSAKHALVHPDTILEPYDEPLPRQKDYLRAWGFRVQARLTGHGLTCSSPFEIHAGADYVAGLHTLTPGCFTVPMAGLQIGEQLSAYRRVLSEAA